MKHVRLFAIVSIVMLSVFSSVGVAQDLSATRPRQVKELQQQPPVDTGESEVASNTSVPGIEPNANVLAPWVRFERPDSERAMQALGERFLKPAAAKSTGPGTRGGKETKPAAANRQPSAQTPEPKCENPDCRDGFEGSFYVGYAVDTFAASDLRKYLNPNDSGGVTERFVGGFDFAYRLFGDPTKTKPQLWVYGETVHGVRSTDVDCKANPELAVCKDLFDPVNAPDATLFILRNATSLEAFAGLRYEFKTLNAGTDYAANLYIKGQLGFLTVAGGGDDVVDMHHVALGLIATKGRYKDSYFEAGFGKTDLFNEHRNRRFKVDGFLSWELPGAMKNRMRPFAQMTVDSDFGKGADSIQSYFGFDFDLVCLFKIANDCSKD